jgi:hypothetical protein
MVGNQPKYYHGLSLITNPVIVSVATVLGAAGGVCAGGGRLLSLLSVCSSRGMCGAFVYGVPVLGWGSVVFAGLVLLFLGWFGFVFFFPVGYVFFVLGCRFLFFAI